MPRCSRPSSSHTLSVTELGLLISFHVMSLHPRSLSIVGAHNRLHPPPPFTPVGSHPAQSTADIPVYLFTSSIHCCLEQPPPQPPSTMPVADMGGHLYIPSSCMLWHRGFPFYNWISFLMPTFPIDLDIAPAMKVYFMLTSSSWVRLCLGIKSRSAMQIFPIWTSVF